MIILIQGVGIPDDELTFATNIVVGSERSAAAVTVIGLSKLSA